MFEILFYENQKGECPIEDFLSDLLKRSNTSKTARVLHEKIYHYFKLLERFGTKAGDKCVKHIEGDIWELRPIDNRIFFFYWKNNKFVMLHYFQKKTQKTPKREIEKAKANMEDFLRRNEQ